MPHREISPVWSEGWRKIGGFFPVGAPVSAVARDPEKLDLFVIGYNGQVYTSWWSEGNDWSGVLNNWRPIGGVFPVGAPVSVVARDSGKLDLFVTHNDGRVYTSWWSTGNDWSGNWRSIGGVFPVGAPVSVVARDSGKLDLFVTNSDGRVYTSWWSEGNDWSGVHDNWRSIGGFFPAGAPVSVISRDPEKLDLFITGHNGSVYTSWWSAGNDWSGVHDNWRNLGGDFPAGAPVSAVARDSGKLDLFITHGNGRVYTSWWSAGNDWFGNWRSIGGFFPAGAPVSVISRDPEKLDLFITGHNGSVYTSWWSAGNDWSGVHDNWRNLGGDFPAGAPVKAVSRNSKQLDLFNTDDNGRINTIWCSVLHAPVINELIPSSFVQDNVNFPLAVQIQGNFYYPGVLVLWNDIPQPTNFSNSTVVTTTLPAGLRSNPQSGIVKIRNTDTQESNEVTITVVAKPTHQNTSTARLEVKCIIKEARDILQIGGTGFLGGEYINLIISKSDAAKNVYQPDPFRQKVEIDGTFIAERTIQKTLGNVITYTVSGTRADNSSIPPDDASL